MKGKPPDADSPKGRGVSPEEWPGLSLMGALKLAGGGARERGRQGLEGQGDCLRTWRGGALRKQWGGRSGMIMGVRPGGKAGTRRLANAGEAKRGLSSRWRLGATEHEGMSLPPWPES